jgi:hypothetical protein
MTYLLPFTCVVFTLLAQRQPVVCRKMARLILLLDCWKRSPAELDGMFQKPGTSLQRHTPRKAAAIVNGSVFFIRWIYQRGAEFVRLELLLDGACEETGIY